VIEGYTDFIVKRLERECLATGLVRIHLNTVVGSTECVIGRGDTCTFGRPASYVKVLTTTAEEPAREPAGETEWHGAGLICTVPIGVLQAEAIAFEPPLSARKVLAIGRIT